MAQKDSAERTVLTNKNKPSNIKRWNNLAESCGNLLQSTIHDEEQKWFNQYPIYIEVLQYQKLIAGLKVYHYKSKKLRGIFSSVSSTLTQFGEILFDETVGIEFDDVKTQINKEVQQIIIKERVTSFHSNGFYGGRKKLAVPEKYKTSKSRKFSVAVLDLKNSEEQLWNQLHTTHQKNITIAKKKNLTVFKSENINLFYTLLAATYQRQNKSAPSAKYVSQYFSWWSPQNISELYFVSQDDKVISGAVMQKFGGAAYHVLGGSIPNKINAGHYLLWNIMLRYKKEGISTFILGEVADEIEEENLKFTKGITLFKNRFGTKNIPSGAYTYIIHPIRYSTWNLLQKIFLLLIKQKK